MTSLLLISITLISLASQWLAWKIRLPAILLLLLAGILLGPVWGVVKPDQLFGNLLFPLVSLSVAIILFEGALTLRISEIKGLGDVVRNLVTIGMLVTFIVISGACWLILDISPQISALIGAVTVVTGPTVISPLMRVVKPTKSVSRVLRWEGIIIDPVGAIFTLIVYEFITLKGKTGTFSHLALTLGVTVSVGIITGVLLAWLLGNAIKKHWFPAYLKNFAVLAFVLTAYGLSNTMAEESGLLCVTVMGVWLANMRDLDLTEIIAFKEELSSILLSGIFIVLAARLDLSALINTGYSILLLLLVVQFIARPLCIAVSTIKSDLEFREKLLLGWIAPRGIVAAAVSALFSLSLQQNEYQDADKLVTVVFAIIIGTVIFQSLTSNIVARLLKVKTKPPEKVLIVGANAVSRKLAQAMIKSDITVVVADNNRENYHQAKMEGLEAYYGNVWSEHAENHIEFSEIALAIILSPDSQNNETAEYYLSHTIGDEKIINFTSHAQEMRGHESRFQRNKNQLKPPISWHDMDHFMQQSGLIKATNLNSNFGWIDYKEKFGDVIPLFVKDEAGNISSANALTSPSLPCTVISLITVTKNIKAKESSERE